MASIAYQPSPKARGKSRHGRHPSKARMRTGTRRSAAQLRTLTTPARYQVRAELRTIRMTASPA